MVSGYLLVFAGKVYVNKVFTPLSFEGSALGIGAYWWEFKMIFWLDDYHYLLLKEEDREKQQETDLVIEEMLA